MTIPDSGDASADLYLADTNIYVTAANDPAFAQRFADFVREHGPIAVSSIVVAEVLIGVKDANRTASVVRAIAAGQPLLTPTEDDWLLAGTITARLGGEAITKSRSFWNDTLLAAQCARLGVTLITHNTPDFRRLGRQVGVRVVKAFP